MRTLGEIMHPACKISLFSWNGKYLAKFEQGLCEQIYKFEHLEIEEARLREIVTGPFINGVLKQFESMQADRMAALD